MEWPASSRSRIYSQRPLRTSELNARNKQLKWCKVAELEELPEGRVKTVTASIHSMALTHIDGAYYAMGNRCPHQGGPALVEIICDAQLV